MQIIRELKEEVSKLKELLVKEGYNPDDLQCKFFFPAFFALLHTSPTFLQENPLTAFLLGHFLPHLPIFSCIFLMFVPF